MRAGRKGLSLAEAAGEGELTCSALDITGRALANMGHFDEAAGMFRRWGVLAEGAGLRMSQLQALMELGNVEFMAGISGERLEAARALAREAGAYTTLVLADLSLGWWLRPHGKLEQAVAVGEEAVVLCRRMRLDLLPQALVSAGTSLNGVEWESGEALLAEGLSLAPEDADVLIVAEMSRGETALRAGRFERADVHLARAAAAMYQLPWAVQGPAPFERVGALLALGRTEEAEAVLEEARALPGLRKVYYIPMFLAAAEALVTASPTALEAALAPAVTNAPLLRAIVLVLGAEVLGGPSAPGWLREALVVFDAAGARDDAARVRRLLRDMGERAPRGRDTPARKTAPRQAERRERKTFMFTDIVGSTTLVEMLGDDAWGHLLRWHDQTLRALFAQHGGEEVKQIGDGFFVAFGRPALAVECAVAIQRALTAHRRDHGFAPQVRIGVHEAEATRKGGDYEGKGVHEAARIGALAEAGEVVASRTTIAHLRRFHTSEPKTVTLKGISEPVEVVLIDWR